MRDGKKPSNLDRKGRVDKFQNKELILSKVNVTIASKSIVIYGSETPVLQCRLYLLLITYRYTMSVYSHPILLPLHKIFYIPIRYSIEFYCPGRGISVFFTMAAFLPLSRGFLVR